MSEKDVKSTADIPVTYRWVLERIVLPICILGISAWLTFINAQVAKINTTLKDLEVRVTTNTVNSNVLIQRLDRIENKLDSLIDKQTSGGK